MEKAKQSQIDGKSPSNAMLSTSNRGLSPRKRRNMFRFGQEPTTPGSNMLGIEDGKEDAGVIEGPGAFGNMPSSTTSSLIPKLNIDGERNNTDRVGESGKKKGHNRQLSDSSRGSIGRKERLRNALTGRSDGSADGADQPKELPKEELIDFLLQYDRTDPFSFKLIEHEKGSPKGSDNMSGRGSVNSGAKLSDDGATEQSSKEFEGGSDT
jgi:hypothetical protein